ncbi:hypothetical protein CKAH01_08598 [Colletotrichum kahawae]|uniref:Uncharacterized protein n=1 Tax=Colletotrichum kahawae TaxID=34407 RepID=A0AAE0D0A9_COLKA|nr:hypothetical protein CKAH01_08598 [Colletotrichum kahawae]
MAAMIAKSKESDRLYEAKLAQLKELVAGMTFRPATPDNPTTPEKSYDYSEWSPTPITISDFEPTVSPSDASFSYTRSPTHSPLLAIPSSVAEWDHLASASSPSLSAVAESDTPSSASASSPSPAPSSLRDEDIAALQRQASHSLLHGNLLLSQVPTSLLLHRVLRLLLHLVLSVSFESVGGITVSSAEIFASAHFVQLRILVRESSQCIAQTPELHFCAHVPTSLKKVSHLSHSSLCDMACVR